MNLILKNQKLQQFCKRMAQFLVFKSKISHFRVTIDLKSVRAMALTTSGQRRWTRDLVKDVAILVENAKRARSIALESILGPRGTEDLSAGTDTLAFTPNTV